MQKEERMDICKLCNSETVSADYSLYDDRYGYTGDFDLQICLGCGHKALKADFTNQQLSDLYTNYYPRSNLDLSAFTPLPEAKGFGSWLRGEFRAFSAVPRSVRILDIGCGFGESLAYHKSRGCEAYGVEADENIKRVAEKYGFSVKVGPFNAKDYGDNFFDYVTMDQVLEHLVNPVEELKGINAILKPGGYLVMTTPNSNGWGTRIFGKKWINWHAPYHLQHFSKRSLKKLAALTGFECKKIKTITSSEWLFYQWIHNATFPKMGEPSPFWSSKGKGLNRDQEKKLQRYNLWRRLRLNQIITRFFDLLGIGDNYIIYFRKS